MWAMLVPEVDDSPQSNAVKVKKMITGIQVPEYKILKDVNVPVSEQLTVVVGPNGSGKSTLLSSIKSVTSGLAPASQKFRGFIRIKGLTPPLFPQNEAWIECVASRGETGQIAWEINGRQRTQFDGHHQKCIQDMLRPRFLKLSAESASRVSYTEAVTPVLGDDGANLASVIGGYLKSGRTDIVDSITTSLKGLVPQIHRIWVENASLEREETEIISVGPSQYPVTRTKSYWGERLMFDTWSYKGLPAHEMSEGTILATALLTLLHGENPPNLLLMDDIDKGLHPRAIASLVEILRGIMEQRPDLQIIATTHSPYLLDQIPVESVICMHVADDGYARAKPLTDHPEYPRWKGVMTAGEFWGTMGDEWVTRDEKAVAQ